MEDSTVRFLYGCQSIALPRGGHWAAPGAVECYRDTAIETMTAIIQKINAGTPWIDAVTSVYGTTNPWLCAIVTNPHRSLFFRHNPPPQGARVLDIGAGWGQISLPLARRIDLTVTALEPTPERLAFIRAAAAQDGTIERMHFIEADFFACDFITRFDLVCCIGVLEWVPRFRPGEPRSVQRSFLERARSLLAPGGYMVIGIENRLGLKYLLGARDDHTGQRYVSVLDAATATAKHLERTGQQLRVLTYSLAEYTELFHEAGFHTVTTYGAFPDYKLPELIIPCEPAAAFNHALSSARLPLDHDGHDGHILQEPETFRSHYRSLAQLGIAHCFCPSYYFALR